MERAKSCSRIGADVGKGVPVNPLKAECAVLIEAAPVTNRRFHVAELSRAIGREVNEALIVTAVVQCG